LKNFLSQREILFRADFTLDDVRMFENHLDRFSLGRLTTWGLGRAQRQRVNYGNNSTMATLA
jgi:hypothetical protein